MRGFDVTIPGDLSAAAFLLVAAQLVRQSRVTARGVGVNPTRTGILEIARDMGAGLSIVPGGDRAGEPIAGRSTRGRRSRSAPWRSGAKWCRGPSTRSRLRGGSRRRASGTTRISNAEELRVKESDRVATMAAVLPRVRRRVRGEARRARHPGDRRAARAGRPAESKGDHRIAMTAAVLALAGRALRAASAMLRASRPATRNSSPPGCAPSAPRWRSRTLRASDSL